MQDYSISKCSRKCAVSGRSLEPGESYFSVILPDGENVRRIDVAASEWKGPDDQAIGWWRSRMPQAGARKLRPAPSGVLLDTLSDLLQRPGCESLAYVLALLLVRRKVLTEEQSIDEDEPHELAPHWTLICNADDRKWNVPIAPPTADNVETIKRELNALLFTEE